MSNNITLICKRVIFYSPIDQDLFFQWIERISAIERFKGVLDEIHLYVEDPNLDYNNLRELVALLDRYKIDMKQLQVFLNDSNKHWLTEFVT